jgi:phosphoribosyl 1,2-cyclic phosphodiesterase
MALKISVLNSGSCGNSTLLSSENTNILIDAGLSGRETAKRLSKFNVLPSELNGILVSHGHRDHIKGLGVLARRFEVPIYINRKTSAEVVPVIGDIPVQNFIKTGGDFQIGDIEISTFSIPHDSADPIGFILKNNNTEIAHLTDIGKISDSILKKIRDKHLILIESNHDLDMLISGPYPEHLKRRIIGPKGHLSNISAAHTLVEAIGSKTEMVILAHLSENNNHPDIVRTTVKEILEEEGLRDIDIKIASRYNAMAPIRI